MALRAAGENGLLFDADVNARLSLALSWLQVGLSLSTGGVVRLNLA